MRKRTLTIQSHEKLHPDAVYFQRSMSYLLVVAVKHGKTGADIAACLICFAGIPGVVESMLRLCQLCW